MREDCKYNQLQVGKHPTKTKFKAKDSRISGIPTSRCPVSPAVIQAPYTSVGG